MKKIDVVQMAGQIVVSIGVVAIVGNMIRTTTPCDVNKVKKVCIWVGGFVLASIASDKATTYAGKMITDIANGINGIMEKSKQ